MKRLLLAHRVRLARKHAKLSFLELAKKIEAVTGAPIEAAHIEALESGQAPASGRIVHIAIACNVSARWLQSNEGAMIQGGVTSDLDVPEVPVSLEEQELIRLWRMIPPELRPSVSKIIEGLTIGAPSPQTSNGNTRLGTAELLSSNLRRIMMRHGHTAESLSKLVRIDPKSISEILDGRTATQDEAVELAKPFGLTGWDLLSHTLHDQKTGS